MIHIVRAASILVLLCVGAVAQSTNSEMAKASPQETGVSSEKLQGMEKAIRGRFPEVVREPRLVKKAG